MTLCFQYVVETYNSGLARSGCVYAAELAMESAIEVVAKSGLTACPYDKETQYDDWYNDACCNSLVTVC